MDDLISRQAAIEIVEEWLWNVLKIKESDGQPSVFKRLRNLPSAQPGIIRCKECKHYKLAEYRAFGMPVKVCEWFGFEDVDDDDFCSRAERRTNEVD